MNLVEKYYAKCNTPMLDDYLTEYLKDNQIELYKTWLDELFMFTQHIDKKELTTHGLIDVNVLVQGSDYQEATILYNDDHQIIFKISCFGAYKSMPSEMILTILEDHISFGFDQSVADPRHFAEYEPEIQQISTLLFQKNFTDLTTEETHIIIEEWIYPIVTITDFDFLLLNHTQQINWLEKHYIREIPIYFSNTNRILTFKRSTQEDMILNKIIDRYKDLFQTYLTNP